MASIHFSVERQHAELTYGREYAADHGGLLPDDRFWTIVEHKFSVTMETGHLHRFQHYHPFITPLLLTDYELRHQRVATLPPPVATLPPPVATLSPPVPMTPPSAPGQATPPPSVVVSAVPEPTSWLLLGLGLCLTLCIAKLLGD